MHALRNLGTSTVLCALILGAESPTQVGLKLKIAAPSAHEQIGRLVRDGFVTQRPQGHYEVNWDALIAACIRIGFVDPFVHDKWRARLSRLLARNIAFRDLVKKYLELSARIVVLAGPSFAAPLENYMVGLEDAVVDSWQRLVLKKHDHSSSSVKELCYIFDEWTLRPGIMTSTVAFAEACRELGWARVRYPKGFGGLGGFIPEEHPPETLEGSR